MPAEELLALVEGDGMGVDAPDVFEVCAHRGDQAVRDPQVHLAADDQAVLEEEVVVLEDRSHQRVLHRRQTRVGAMPRDRGEHVGEVPRGDGLDATAQELDRGLFAEGAALALDGNAQGTGEGHGAKCVDPASRESSEP
jgi:hypothetical protein